MKFQTALMTLFVCLTGSATLRADLKVKTRYAAGTETNEQTVYFQGARQRFEWDGGAVIDRPDQQRLIQIDNAAKTFRIMPTPKGAEAAGKGGTVVMTTKVHDTGERKQMFGHEARHLKTTITREPDGNACDKTKSRIESDGWYIDVETPAPRASAAGGCHDEIVQRAEGDGKLGYPVAYETKSWSGDAKTPSVVKMEVLELSADALDAALFEAPAGFAEVKDPEAKPGNRIGMEISSGPAGKITKDALTNSLSRMLLQAGYHPVESTKDCDYVLYTEVADVHQQSGAVAKVSRFTGGLGRRFSKGAAVAPPAGEALEVTVNYKLVKHGEAAPLLEATASGKNGGVGVLGMVRLAASVMPMTMMLKSFGGPMMMMQVSGGGGMSAIDPMMGSFMSLFPASHPGSEIKAVNAALEAEVKAVAEKLKTLS